MDAILSHIILWMKLIFSKILRNKNNSVLICLNVIYSVDPSTSWMKKVKIKISYYHLFDVHWRVTKIS